jgi:hypothetical protein
MPVTLRDACLLALLATTLPAAARAEDDAEPAAGAPFSVGDAYTSDAGQFQLQGTFGYERARGGREGFTPGATLKYGLNDRMELSLDGAYGLGNDSGVNLGSIGPALTWRLADQEGWRPTLSLSLGAAMPFGPGRGGWGTELGAATSWVTGSGTGHWGLHLNAGFLATIDPLPGERPNGYLFGGAISHVLNPQTVLVAAYAQQTQDEGERDLRLVEAGVIRNLTETLSLGLAAGAGVNRDSPRLRLTAALTYSFGTGSSGTGR